MTVFVTTFLAVVSTQLRRTFWSRRTLVCLTLVIIPAIPLIVARSRGDASQVASTMGAIWYLILQVTTPLLALIAGSAVLGEESSDGTLAFVFTRPIARSSYYLARTLLASVQVASLILLTWGLLYLLSRPLVPDAQSLVQQAMPIVLLEATVYTSLFAALSAWLRRPMPVGVVYAFAIESLFSSLPSEISEWSVLHRARCMLRPLSDTWKAATESSITVFMPASDAQSGLYLAIGIALVLGILGVRRREL